MTCNKDKANPTKAAAAARGHLWSKAFSAKITLVHFYINKVLVSLLWLSTEVLKDLWRSIFFFFFVFLFADVICYCLASWLLSASQAAKSRISQFA